MGTAPPADAPGLRRELGLMDSALMLVGIVLGAGIFMTTGFMARDLPSPGLIMLAWGVGGLLTLAGAAVFAELGAALPEAGGGYVYLREAYGPLVSFLFAWVTLLVYQPGAISAVAVGFAEHLGYLLPRLGTGVEVLRVALGGFTLSISAAQVVAAATILGLTALNILGLRVGSNILNVITSLKVVALVGFAALGILAGRPSATATMPPSAQRGMADLVSGFGLALVAALWTYDGWINLSFSGGEVKDPGRTIPRALILGTGALTALYLLVNVVYLFALTIPEMQGVTRVAEKATTALFGARAGIFMVAVVALSTFGGAHGTVLTGARLYYAVAKDGFFFRSMAHVHAKHHTPDVALWVQGALAAVLALSGRFDQLFTYCMFAALLMYAATTASVMTLRRKRPDLPRPYLVWPYPALPILYITALMVLCVNTLLTRPMESLSGLLIVASGVPVFFFWRGRTRASGPSPSAPPS
jgi:basic amino acid/polyamine antiporter, APA family